MLSIHPTYALVSLALASNPPETAVSEEVDLIELNHLYDGQGVHVLDQIIFYDWSPREGRFNVRAWRLYKRPSQVPLFDERQNCHVAVWHDKGALRRVSATSFRETWTQHDPEIQQRSEFPPRRRCELASHSSSFSAAEVQR